MEELTNADAQALFLKTVQPRSLEERTHFMNVVNAEPMPMAPPATEERPEEKTKQSRRKSRAETRKQLILQISKNTLKANCIGVSEVQPVDELLMQHGKVRVKQPPHGKCFFESLLWHLKKEHIGKQYEIEFDTVQTLAKATADELYENWDHYSVYMALEYMQLNFYRDKTAIRNTCDEIAKFVWNIPVADAMVMAGATVVRRVLRIWTDGGFYDVLWRDMPKQQGKEGRVYDLVNTGSHYDTGDNIEDYKVMGVADLLSRFHALNTEVHANDVLVVLAQVADTNRGCPQAKAHAKVFSVRMKDGTQRVVPWSILNADPRTQAMMRDINRFAHVKAIHERRFDKDLWPFYLCSFNLDVNSAGEQMGQVYVDRRYLARDEVAERVVRMYEKQNPYPNPVVPTPETQDESLWLKRFKWKGINRNLPEYIPDVDDNRTAQDDLHFETETSAFAEQALAADIALEQRLVQEKVLKSQQDLLEKSADAKRKRQEALESAKDMERAQDAQRARVDGCLQTITSLGDGESTAALHSMLENAEGAQDAIDDKVSTAVRHRMVADDAEIIAAKEAHALARNQKLLAALYDEAEKEDSQRLQLELQTARARHKNECAQRELAVLALSADHSLSEGNLTTPKSLRKSERLRESQSAQVELEGANGPIAGLVHFLPQSRQCADCTANGRSARDASTIPCCATDCTNWTHADCGTEQVNPPGTYMCAPCFQKTFDDAYKQDEDVGEEDCEDDQLEGSVSVAQAKEKSKYRYSGPVTAAKSNCCWFSRLAYKHVSVESGARMSTGHTLEAFGYFENASKTYNVALVSKPDHGGMTLANISWLGLDSGTVTPPKAGRF